MRELPRPPKIVDLHADSFMDNWEDYDADELLTVEIHTETILNDMAIINICNAAFINAPKNLRKYGLVTSPTTAAKPAGERTKKQASSKFRVTSRIITLMIQTIKTIAMIMSGKLVNNAEPTAPTVKDTPESVEVNISTRDVPLKTVVSVKLFIA